MFKVNKKTPEQCQWRRSGVFTVNLCSKLTKKHQNNANGVVLVSLLLTLNIFQTLFYCFYC